MVIHGASAGAGSVALHLEGLGCCYGAVMGFEILFFCEILKVDF
jgi:hypothetical protein